ncbi:MAG: UvrD-helicase domain-containing protein [Prevotella sp.]|nr:UvrD-helicase domain-containing protein [Prevotella sp.]
MNQKEQLTVYKASAGSGKTFRLACEYIKLLIDQPTRYRHILAVTFTNKATEEMKERILSQLYGIWKKLSSSNDYLNEVMSSLQMDQDTASQKAGIALHQLLHDYSYFRVETIDSFFQTVLRNLARELDLTANLRVELNDEQVEEQAVDLLIEQLKKDDMILKWLISYIEQNIEEDKSWNVIGQVKKFGKTIFREYYKTHSEELNARIAEKGFFPKYVKELEALRAQAKKTMNDLGDQFFEIIEEHGLTPDSFANKTRGIPSYFKKLQGNDFSDKICFNNTVENCLVDSEKWTSKSSPDRNTIISLADSTLMPLLNEAERIRHQQWKIYLSADVTLSHLNQVRLLNNIEKQVRELNEEANRFLLSDTQQFLHELIDDSDSPFIFEKIGAQLEHIMIDEFQDTSTVQWQNFKLLLEETMSRDSSELPADVIRNMIVGDVKQSIYRWRNGDWRLLNGIDQQFPRGAYQLKTHHLDTNYRSSYHVVTFNNAFFAKAAELEHDNEAELSEEGANELQQAYADVEQVCNKEKDGQTGLVRITLLPQAGYEGEVMNTIVNYVDELKERQVPEQDIAILVRSNRYIPKIADFFSQNRPEITIISDEAFRLDASLAVCMLVSAMQLLIHKDDELARANVEKAYYSIHQKPLGTLLDDVRTALLHLPMVDMVERLYQLLQLNKLEDQGAYLCTFFDKINDFVADNGTDIEGFIKLWDENIHEKTIPSDKKTGIRVISIHKSKGLEFKHLIIPFCDWKLELGGTLWCQPTEAPYNQLPLVPVDYSGKLQDTIYEDDYVFEHLQNCVDNLNLLYVAFTRAKENLFVIGRRDATNTRSMLIQQVLSKLELEGASIEEPEEKDQSIVFEYGTWTTASLKNKEKDLSANVFLQKAETLDVKVESYDSRVDFRQSNTSKDFVDDSSLTEEEQQRKQYVKMGNILHHLFSQIRTTKDIPDILRQLEYDGVLYDEEVSAEKIKSMLEKRLTHPKVSDWFSDRWALFNECSIIRTDEQGELVERRPDRVMTDGSRTIVVDFKFGAQREEYHQQVREYMQLLQQMGHTQVEGYLWYVYSNQIKEVSV